MSPTRELLTCDRRMQMPPPFLEGLGYQEVLIGGLVAVGSVHLTYALRFWHDQEFLPRWERRLAVLLALGLLAFAAVHGDFTGVPRPKTAGVLGLMLWALGVGYICHSHVQRVRRERRRQTEDDDWASYGGPPI